jgi:hypothetical protein
VHARPGYGPRGAALCDLANALRRRGMKLGVSAMGIDQEIGVDRDQEPRPS